MKKRELVQGLSLAAAAAAAGAVAIAASRKASQPTRRASGASQDNEALLTATASLRKKNQQLESLYTVFSEITETLEIRYVIESTLRETIELMRADMAVLRKLSWRRACAHRCPGLQWAGDSTYSSRWHRRGPDRPCLSTRTHRAHRRKRRTQHGARERAAGTSRQPGSADGTTATGVGPHRAADHRRAGRRYIVMLVTAQVRLRFGRRAHH